MAAKAGGDLPEPLRSNSGGPPVTQIFNMFVDAVIRHWVMAVQDPQEGFGN